MAETTEGIAVPTLLIAMAGLFIIYLFLVYPGTRSDIIIDMSVKRVGIDEDGFHPSEIQSKGKVKVRWINEGEARHTVTGKNFNVELAPGESYAHVYEKAGTHTYRCEYHPGEEGRVRVI